MGAFLTETLWGLREVMSIKTLRRHFVNTVKKWTSSLRLSSMFANVTGQQGHPSHLHWQKPQEQVVQLSSYENGVWVQTCLGEHSCACVWRHPRILALVILWDHAHERRLKHSKNLINVHHNHDGKFPSLWSGRTRPQCGQPMDRKQTTQTRAALTVLKC